jgi:hypothetical protein
LLSDFRMTGSKSSLIFAGKWLKAVCQAYKARALATCRPYGTERESVGAAEAGPELREERFHHITWHVHEQ